ncbi:YgjV family protein [Salinisphaera sp. USBA-960]|uniref:YgjV family protein n=1 Tax=Salinisphaera orenii TaxID=856731 RepID=UPI000DBEA944|nr:YgjV family protein [Salifodinibacter halophilus]NNC26350.1 YgjV family protein [Salifodinibacter halophilus]
MPDVLTLRWIAGQTFGVVALTLCIIGFAAKRDDRLFFLLLFANVAFALQFAMFRSWAAAAVTVLIILRIHLVRRYKHNGRVMCVMLVATCVAAALTWHAPRDIWAVAAGSLGTYGMFMHGGVPMRLFLTGAAFCWVVMQVLVGSFGGTLAELLILATNLITVARLKRRGGAL